MQFVIGKNHTTLKSNAGTNQFKKTKIFTVEGHRDTLNKSTFMLKLNLNVGFYLFEENIILFP